MAIKNCSMSFAERFNDVRLYEVEETRGKVYYIRKIEINENDIEKFASIIKKINEGNIWVKRFDRDVKTVKFVGKDLKFKEIEKVYLNRTGKEQKTIEDALENLNGEDESLLENIKKDLEEKLSEEVAKAPHDAHPSSLPSVQTGRASAPITKAKTTQKLEAPKSRTTQDIQKEQQKIEEEINEEHRAEIRENKKLSEEKDKKADKRRHEAIDYQDKQKQITSDAIKKKRHS